MSRIGWWSCPSGASGDMLLGALLDAGAPLAAIRRAVDSLGVERIELDTERVTRGGIRATRVHVRTAEAVGGRDLAAVRALLDQAELAGPVRQRAGSVFELLADAEAAVHGVSPAEVHFHEVGALDALADVVGVLTGLHELGIERSGCTGLALGGGTAGSGHGELPVPVPAVLAILASVGAPVSVGGEMELTTPTGAALLASTVEQWGISPQLAVTGHGYGAGSRERAGPANVAGLVVGEPVDGPAGEGDWLVTEANVDDLDPRLWPGVLAGLLGAGAVDAWLSPILMKKGRPAHTVHALSPAPAAPVLRALLYRETSTIGVRSFPVAKHALDREFATVQVAGAPVRIKLARLDGRPVSATPEFEEVAAAAAAAGRGVREVLAEANAAAAGLLAGGTPQPALTRARKVIEPTS
jgi:uncharacterized protein (TIGR00299 family) protein